MATASADASAPRSFLGDIDAFHDKLAFINDAGNAIMKVDNSSVLKFNQNRNSLRISTKDQFTVGSVWVADLRHVPYGVSMHGTLSQHDLR
ncbi:hypothetical protein TRAPUB_7311 [Trametes pubescens]|uniref:Uncharacterized protein n=1 Tax=Trametes pubescens TaxID=154538 RepID=A0A1M2V3W0_TRAPU|nr:hypothetical protein TRAPUB_7311 [Trametes pubescens]